MISKFWETLNKNIYLYVKLSFQFFTVGSLSSNIPRATIKNAMQKTADLPIFSVEKALKGEFDIIRLRFLDDDVLSVIFVLNRLRLYTNIAMTVVGYLLPLFHFIELFSNFLKLNRTQKNRFEILRYISIPNFQVHLIRQ